MQPNYNSSKPKGKTGNSVFTAFAGTLLLVASVCYVQAQNQFVQRNGPQFSLNGRPYYYVGTNYWYGGVLGLVQDKSRGVERLRKELDFLKSHQVTNLRVLAAAEGAGQVNGVERVAPPLQPLQGRFDEKVLESLDLLLYEMGKRNMKAVLYLSNNWEWSGGFLQYLRWNNKISEETFRRKLNWDEMRDEVSKFYSCDECKAAYLQQVKTIIQHTNKYTGKPYSQEIAIMAWELANEPRPMRPAANDAYKQWISSAAASIKELDKNHLITIGAEGAQGTESMQLFEETHADKNIDYLTIHIWPKNWGWFSGTNITAGFSNVVSNTNDYLKQHVATAQHLNKPLVVEEFGLPRDNHLFNPEASTSLRDVYYNGLLQQWYNSKQNKGIIAGINFWVFNGTARPIPGQTYWKQGDDYMGDPPMEEQGLNGVFDSDSTTWRMINAFTTDPLQKTTPADPKATKETVALYGNLKKLQQKGIMFGHQDDLAYGIGWRNVPGKSDVKELVNDYPAVYGWELGNIEHGLPYNIDSVSFDGMRQHIQQAYAKGSIITISWHLDNPVNGASAWDTTKGSVAAILPGGPKNQVYTQWLDKVADFLLSLRGSKGEYIPVLFRPYHELTGNWFWWGPKYCTPAEFKALWRFTIAYLQRRNVHHLLYVYNTADFSAAGNFLERYPGDDMTDMISFDTYQFNDPAKDSSFLKNTSRQLSILEKIAAQNGKLIALAETGYETIPYAHWWTKTLWPAIKDYKLSYVLVWRNAGLMKSGKYHYYVPAKNDISSDDFKAFYQLNTTLFEKDISKEKLYLPRK